MQTDCIISIQPLSFYSVLIRRHFAPPPITINVPFSVCRSFEMLTFISREVHRKNDVHNSF